MSNTVNAINLEEDKNLLFKDPILIKSDSLNVIRLDELKDIFIPTENIFPNTICLTSISNNISLEIYSENELIDKVLVKYDNSLTTTTGGVNLSNIENKTIYITALKPITKIEFLSGNISSLNVKGCTKINSINFNDNFIANINVLDLSSLNLDSLTYYIGNNSNIKFLKLYNNSSSEILINHHNLD